MDLILWRHAEAEDGFDDLGRPLTEKGRKQAARMARWLAGQLKGKEVRVVSSGAARCEQTARALGQNFEIDTRMNPNAATAAYLEVSRWPHGDGRVTVLVGHQPALGRVASLLMTGRESDWATRKGAIWWVQRRVREHQVHYVLKACIAPEQLD
ncbi:phosphohistidine phosphatase, SixA [Andreprevotia lacus DSM 23236]|jgi:phosphohistidine phosphatase|uniref:Phosphohistidine phosphatase, SixA n=1 Tax=Andreprevotia lacus DSM 23236 TaxID=1121001 RepID=A0A1W1XC18_9NEIS|nr:histidine phosphatase family protein [Andreprevotia lacus]SMC21427.1 phosphohistidine phosphatase, SixA [Andreprevotia lacus DSM 23236]